MEQLLQYPEFVFNANAHNMEHSIEVQIPILQYFFPKVNIVPIIFGNQTLQNGKRLAEILGEVFAENWDDTVVVVSSDLSHYHNLEMAKNMDNLLMEHPNNFDLEKLNESIVNNATEACGIGGIFTLLELSKHLNYDKIQHLRYSSSGEIFGDYQKVVGYLSSVIYK